MESKGDAKRPAAAEEPLTTLVLQQPPQTKKEKLYRAGRLPIRRSTRFLAKYQCIKNKYLESHPDLPLSHWSIPVDGVRETRLRILKRWAVAHYVPPGVLRLILEYVRPCGGEEDGLVPFGSWTSLSKRTDDRWCRGIASIPYVRILDWVYQDNPALDDIARILFQVPWDGHAGRLVPDRRVVHILTALINDPKQRFRSKLAEEQVYLTIGQMSRATGHGDLDVFCAALRGSFNLP